MKEIVRMLKALVFSILVFFITLIDVSALEYKVKDMTISLDENAWSTYETDRIFESPDYGELGLSYGETVELNDYFKENGIYLYSILGNNEAYLYVLVEDGESISNMNYQKSEWIEQVKEQIKHSFNTNVVKEENINGYKYLVYNFYNGDYGIEYLTFMNGRFYKVSLEKESEINSSDENILKSIVKAIKFKNDWRYNLPQDKKDKRDTIIGRVSIIFIIITTSGCLKRIIYKLMDKIDKKRESDKIKNI